MTISEAIQVLEDHNTWRKGAETPPTDPIQLTKALELAINVLKRRDLKNKLAQMKKPFQNIVEEPHESLRDKFAGRAMQGILSKYGMDGTVQLLSETVYSIADEMLKQRKL